MIPSFLLAKLYIKGSLKNTETGFEFALKNIIESAILIGIGPITVGEQIYQGAAITMTIAERSVNGAEMARRNPLVVPMGADLKVSVAGDKLDATQQKISVSATTSQIGEVKFDINDTVN